MTFFLYPSYGMCTNNMSNDVYDRVDDNTKIEKIDELQNWEEFGILNETSKTQEKENIENDLDTNEEENELIEKIIKGLVGEEADKEEITKENLWCTSQLAS